jgi:hypothetical protein
MDKPLIHIPDICKPGLDTTLGHSGGMVLYVADWESVMLIFQYTNIPLLVYYTWKTTPLN